MKWLRKKNRGDREAREEERARGKAKGGALARGHRWGAPRALWGPG